MEEPDYPVQESTTVEQMDPTDEQSPLYNQGYHCYLGEDPYIQGVQLPLQSILRDAREAAESARRRSTRLANRSAAGRGVTWDPVTEEIVRFEELPPEELVSLPDLPPAPTSAPVAAPSEPENADARLGERLARQPVPITPSLNPPPTSPLQPAVAPRGPTRGADYGRTGDSKKMPMSFRLRPFGDLEPGTVNEEEPPGETLPVLGDVPL